MPADVPAAASLRVWDPVVRLFHWSLVASFGTAFLIDDDGQVHETAGYVVLGLLAVRLVWGLIGTRHARFADFVRGPGSVVAYLRDLAAGRAERYLGHNPAGGAMILLLILAVGTTALTGWLSTTDQFWGVEWLEELHEVAAYLSVGLIALHVLGVVASSWLHQENLVRAMITGRKRA